MNPATHWTPAQAARAWGLSASRVYILLAAGRIPGAGRDDVTHHWRIPADSPRPVVMTLSEAARARWGK